MTDGSPGTEHMSISAVASSFRARAAQHRGAIRSIVAIVGGNSTAAVLGAIGGVLAARFVDPETAGRFRFYTIPLMYLTFLHLGTFDGLSRQIPFYLGQERRDEVDTAASVAGAWNVLLSVFVSGNFLVLSAWCLVRRDVFGALGWASQALVVWWVFYGGYLSATYRTIDHFVGMARIQTTQALLSFGFVFTLPVLGFGGLCLRSAVPSICGTWLLHRERPLRIRLALRLNHFRDLVRVGLPFCLWGSLYTSLWNAVENTLMLALGGTRGLGLFTVAVMMREGICILPQAVSQVLTPRIVQKYGREGHLGSASQIAYRVVPPLALGMVVVVFGVSWVLDAFVPTFIPTYADGLPLMKVSLWFGVVQAVAVPANALIASGRSWSVGRGVLAGMAVFPLVTLALVHVTGGVVAVAAGSLAGKAVRAAVGYFDLRRLVLEEGR
ncbi:lipopolysaccharide biosynthesis protein [Anaeromyxobacter oryzisoli]|uniref:lipopolysaccharide biosynthesis protein n=1 Tax=Anaeromyxobacter oryzisoli TaxID=2925408 RepID=UPI001F5A0F3C|nr:hypothetical protein [Anaeromyxobacter sp. SG63]